jgi:hypothetical protein
MFVTVAFNLRFLRKRTKEEKIKEENRKFLKENANKLNSGFLSNLNLILIEANRCAIYSPNFNQIINLLHLYLT